MVGEHLPPPSLYSLPCPSISFHTTRRVSRLGIGRRTRGGKKKRWQEEEEKEEEKILTFPIRFFLIQTQR
jgi:hypothetical protein